MTSSPDASAMVWTLPQFIPGWEAVPAPAPADEGPLALPDLAGGEGAAPEAPAGEPAAGADPDGLRDGEARARAALAPAIQALEGVHGALAAAAAEFARTREHDLWTLALAVARKLVQRELVADPAMVRDLVARALELLPLDTALEVRLHPADLELLGPERDRLTPSGRLLAIQWVADPALERGGFVIESPQRLVDGRADVALRALYERLTHE